MDNLFFKEQHVMIKNMVHDFAKKEIAPVALEFVKTSEIPKEIV